MATPLSKSFRDAFSGIAYVLRTQRNARIHFGITVAVVVVGIWLKIGSMQWVALIIVAGLVWTAELVNTAVEAVVDLASPQEHPLARVAKDICAGAVLLAAIAAVLVGALVLGPPLLTRLFP